MSSTTDARHAERGQVLVLLAGGMVAILAIAALVFDVGQNLLDRRTEQNVADAAALAGARYMPGATYTYHAGCAAIVPADQSARPAAYWACKTAQESNYLDGQDSRTVRVDIPPVAPANSLFQQPGFIQVQVGSTRGSFFAGILGVVTQRTGAYGVATNDAHFALPYSLLSLDPNSCGVNKVNGGPGSGVTTGGTVHVDSSCTSDALLLSGNGVLNSPECDVVGGIQTSGGATNNCTSAPSGVQVSGDPLQGLAYPPEPATLGNFTLEPGETMNPPASCPNGAAVTPAIKNNPQACTFNSSFAGHSYRMWPGYYPGGLQLNAGTFYMEPGIYWIAGGGLTMTGSGANLISVNSGTQTYGGGILIFNGEDSTFHTECAANPTFNAGCFGPISLQGSSAMIELNYIQTGAYKGMVIFQDRANTKTMVMNGSNTTWSITGTIYAAAALVKLNGSSTTSISAQIICYDFQINGNGAVLNIPYNPDGLFQLTGVGLVNTP